MPIIGLTDRGLSFPEIGQIRKGIKEERTRRDGSKYQVPVDLSYFRVEFDQKESSTAEKFRKIYGDEPQEINIILPFDEIERTWDAWLEAYTAGRLVARSDGKRFTYLIDTATGDIIVKNGEPYRPYQEGQVVGNDYENKPVFAKPVGRLKVIVPELARAAYMTVMTTSIHDIANLSAQLEAFKQINGGVIKGIPLILRRRPKKISVPKKDGGRVRMEKWLLSIEADPEWVKMKLSEVQTLALPGDYTYPWVPAGEESEPDLIEAVLPGTWSEELEEHEEEDLEIPQLMDLERAKQVQTGEGVPYGDVPLEDLRKMWGSIQAAINLKDPQMDPDVLLFKRDAIITILKAAGETVDQPGN